MKYINAINFLVIIIIYSAIQFSWWISYPYKTVSFNTTEHKVDTKVVHGGEYLQYTVDYCKYTDITPKVTRYFVDEIKYLISDNEVAVKKDKGCGITNIFLYIPKGLPPDVYQIELIYHYKVNPIREINVVSHTEKFIVE